MDILDIYNSIAIGLIDESLTKLDTITDISKEHKLVLISKINEMKGNLELAEDLIDEVDEILYLNSNKLIRFATLVIRLYISNRKSKKLVDLEELIINTNQIIEDLRNYNFNSNEKTIFLIWLGYYYNVRAMLYQNEGNYNDAEYYYKICIDIRKELDNKIYLGMTMNNLGVYYLEVGEFLTSKSFFAEALGYAKDYNSCFLRSYINTNLGLVSYFTYEFKDGLQHINNAIKLLDECKGSILLKSTCFQYKIFMLLELDQKEEALSVISQLKVLNEHYNYAPINHAYRIAMAQYYKSEQRIKSYAKSIAIFEELINQKELDYLNTRIVMKSLSDLYLNEYLAFGEDSILTDFEQIISVLYQIAYSIQSYPLQIEVKIFQAKYELSKGNFSVVEQLVNEALIIAQAHELRKIEQNLQQFKKEIYKEIQYWQKVFKKNGQISKYGVAKILEYMQDIQKIIN